MESNKDDLASVDTVDEAWVLLNQAFDAAYRAASKKLQPIGVSPEQARLLVILGTSSYPPTCTEISRIVMRKPHTITALLNGMQRAGLIRRIKDERNQKLVRVVMTKKGREVRKQILQTHLSLELRSSMSRGEFYQLISALEKLRDTALKQL
jgi:DNA-binding MarR family transcriptional regulator